MNGDVARKLDRIVQLFALIAALIGVLILTQIGVDSVVAIVLLIVIGGFVITALVSALTGKRAIGQ
ncbi:hypothetical protein [Natronosalvus vescus]|uniref:hypothetical protein n=1 Tax=Natronosalvus vescus TaxID=2953881 RepID=UPI00209035D3|nr:hypothetical protein [Natronosalvus vescus]